jgi:hypothetical protein
MISSAMRLFAIVMWRPIAHKAKVLGGERRKRDSRRGFVERHRHSGCSAHGLQLSGAGRRGESGVQLCGASGVVFGEGGKQTAEKKKKNSTRKVLW